jgi:hypothetical protein
LRDVCKLKFSGAGGDRVAITADGTVLAKNFSTCVRDALKAWDALPEEQRKPNAIKIGEREAGDDSRHEPPPGGLIVKVYLRALGRDKDGRLRHAVPQDFIGDGDLRARYLEINPNLESRLKGNQADLIAHHFQTRKRIYEAHPDYMWLTEAEWKSLVPDEAKAGDTFPVPPGISKRIFRFHLDLNRTVGDPIPQKIHVGELSLKVDSVSPEEIDIRLGGFAKVSDDLSGDNRRTFEARMYGRLVYDRRKAAFSRFDMLALGDTYGPFEAGLGHWPYSRPGRSPYGIAFELLGAGSPAERYVPPRGAGPRFTWKSYFGTVK